MSSSSSSGPSTASSPSMLRPTVASPSNKNITTAPSQVPIPSPVASAAAPTPTPPVTSTPITLKQCQTMLIIRTVCTLFNAICIVQLTNDNILSLLHKDAIDMERWDPSDIIAVPFPIDVLKPFVYRSILNIILPSEAVVSSLYLSFFTNQNQNQNRRGLSSSLRSRHTSKGHAIRSFAADKMSHLLKIMNYILFLLACHMVTFIIAVCCGASPYSVEGQGVEGNQANSNGGAGAGGGGHAPVYHTILATGYLSTLAFGYIQPVTPDGGNVSNHGSGRWKLKLLNVARSWRNILEHVLMASGSGTGTGGGILETKDSDEGFENEHDRRLSHGHDERKSGTSITLGSAPTSGQHHQQQQEQEQEKEHYQQQHKPQSLEFLRQQLGYEMNSCIVYSTCGITIPFMILNILDHGNQLQRWPVPILVGALVGHVVGVVIAIAVGWYRLYQWKKERSAGFTSTSARTNISININKSRGSSEKRTTLFPWSKGKEGKDKIPILSRLMSPFSMSSQSQSSTPRRQVPVQMHDHHDHLS